jgi:hypothetical protein
MTTRIVLIWQYIVAAALFLAMLAALQFFPSDYWLEVRSVNVKRAKVGEPIELAVDRTINRNFHAQWAATVRQWDGSGWVVYCNASGISNYSTKASFPKPLTFGWWTWDQCKTLPAGRYQLETVWNIDGLGLMPDKQVSAMSNVFDVE